MGDRAGLERLLPEWEALFQLAGATPTCSPGWSTAWARALPAGGWLVAAVRTADRLVGVAPLRLGRGGRLLAFGSGWEPEGDVLLDPEHREEAGAALVDLLRGRAAGPWVMELAPGAAAWSLPTRPGDHDRMEPVAAYPLLRTGAGEADPRASDVTFDASLEALGAGASVVPALAREGHLQLRARRGGAAWLVVTCGRQAWAHWIGAGSPDAEALGDALAVARSAGAEVLEARHFGDRARRLANGVSWRLRRTVRFGERAAAAEVRSGLELMHRLIERRDLGDPLPDPLAQLARRVPDAPRTVAALLHGVEHGGTAPTPHEGVARWEEVFDRAARLSPEGSVALYSLGDPELLRAATAEIVDRLRDWGLLSPDRRVLDLGCGIGRIAEAVAGDVAEVVGIDVSREMLAEAVRRCARWPNVRLVRGSGLDLGELTDRAFELVLAVDSFPYLVQAGPSVVEGHFAEIRRVLSPGGSFVLLQFSYRGDAERDRTEVRALAEAHGFVLVRAGRRELAGWDGLAFHLWWPGPRG